MVAGALRVDAASETQSGVDIVGLDSRWGAAVTGDPGREPWHEVQLDLRSAEFIHHESLLYLVGVLAFRSARKQETKLLLPRLRVTREFLWAWGLPEAVKGATQRDFESFLLPDDQAVYSADEQRGPRYLRYEEGPAGRESLLPETFFAITPVHLRGSALDIATVATAPWRRDHIVSVLDGMFDGNGGRVASHVVQEAVLNAASHPGATKVYASSQLLKPKTSSYPSRRFGPSRNELDISIWDNGKSVAETLLEAWKTYGTVAAPAFGVLKETFDFRILDRDGETRFSEIVDTGNHVSTASSEHLLLSAFFLGVSREPNRSISTDSPWMKDLPADWLPATVRPSSGLGLYLIRRTVLDLFGGSLSYATGRYRLVLRRDPTGEADCIARLVVLRDSDPQVQGNLLSVRIGPGTGEWASNGV